MNANHRIQMNYDMLLFIFLCPSDGDVKSEVPCSVNATPRLCTLKIPPAEFVKSRLLGAATEVKFVREHKIYSFGRGTQNCRR